MQRYKYAYNQSMMADTSHGEHQLSPRERHWIIHVFVYCVEPWPRTSTASAMLIALKPLLGVVSLPEVLRARCQRGWAQAIFG